RDRGNLAVDGIVLKLLGEFSGKAEGCARAFEVDEIPSRTWDLSRPFEVPNQLLRVTRLNLACTLFFRLIRGGSRDLTSSLRNDLIDSELLLGVLDCALQCFVGQTWVRRLYV